jgi:uncharacterized protein DUF4190
MDDHFQQPPTTPAIEPQQPPPARPVYHQPPLAPPAYVPHPQYPVVHPTKPNGLAVASMVLGIVGVLISWFTFALPSLLATILGGVGLHQIAQARNPYVTGKGMAITGLVLGVVVLIPTVLFMLFLGVGAVGAAFSGS